jgi:hypothetical protein
MSTAHADPGDAREAIGQLLPFAVGVAVSPMPVVVVAAATRLER